MTVVLIRKGEFGHRHTRRRTCDNRGREWQDAAASQGPPATRSWERQEDPPIQVSEGMQPCGRLSLRLPPARTMRPKKILFCFLTTQFVVLGYGSYAFSVGGDFMLPERKGMLTDHI